MVAFAASITTGVARGKDGDAGRYSQHQSDYNHCNDSSHDHTIISTIGSSGQSVAETYVIRGGKIQDIGADNRHVRATVIRSRALIIESPSTKSSR